jgi:hypothetical protein
MKSARVVLLAMSCAALGFGQAEEKDPGGKGDIKVHGHWLLQVRNPDGSVASRHEFENSLVTSNNLFAAGPFGLAQLLTGQAYASQWIVALTNSITACCAVFSIQQTPCPGTPSCSPLTVTQTANLAGLVLQGTSAPAAAAATISTVATYFFACPLSQSPSQCFASEPLVIFTAANANLSLQTGQAVTVTVTFSFS